MYNLGKEDWKNRCGQAVDGISPMRPTCESEQVHYLNIIKTTYSDYNAVK